MQIKSVDWRAVIDSQSIPYDVIVNIRDLTGANVVSFGGMTLDDVSYDRALTSDMPANTRFVSGGYPAAGASISLSGLLLVAGEFMAIDDFLNPWNAASPNYLIDWTSYLVTIDVRVFIDGTPDATRVFTGEIDELTVNHNSGGVTITCVDFRSRLRALPDLPIAFADVPGARTFSQYTSAPLAKQVLTSLYVVDYLFSKAGFSTVLPDRPGSFFRVSGHGGAFPEKAPNGNVTAVGNDTFTAGRYFPQLCGAYYADISGAAVSDIVSPDRDPSAYSIDTAARFGQGRRFTYEGWIKDDGTDVPAFSQTYRGAYAWLTSINPATLITDSLILGVQRISGVLVPFATYRDGTSFTNKTTTQPTRAVPIDGNWHYVLISAAIGTGASPVLTLTVWLDGAAALASTVTLTGYPVPVESKLSYASLESSVTADSAQVSQEPTLPTTINNAYVPAIVPFYDPSLNNLTVIPDTAGKDAWGVIQQLAQAEQAVCGLSESGVPFFVNRQTLRTMGPTREINSKSALKTLNTRVARSAVATHIQVPVSGYSFNQVLEAVWSTTEYIAVAPLGTYSVIAAFSTPVVGVYAFGGPIRANGVGLGAGVYPLGSSQTSGYRASTTASGSGPAIVNLVMRVYQLSPTTALVTVYNPNAYAAYLVTPSIYPADVGSPYLVVAGRPGSPSGAVGGVTQAASYGVIADAQWPPAEQGGAASNPYGDVLLSVAANPFLQSSFSGQDLADDLLADLAYPRPILENISIMLDPSLQLGDRVTIVDPSRAKINDDAQVFSVSCRLSSNAAGMTIGARTVGTPGAWIMGAVGKSEMGVNTRV